MPLLERSRGFMQYGRRLIEVRRRLVHEKTVPQRGFGHTLGSCPGLVSHFH
jgi:hypothetical protein